MESSCISFIQKNVHLRSANFETSSCQFWGKKLFCSCKNAVSYLISTLISFECSKVSKQIYHMKTCWLILTREPGCLVPQEKQTLKGKLLIGTVFISFDLILSGTKFKCFNKHLAQPEEKQTLKGKQLIGALWPSSSCPHTQSWEANLHTYLRTLYNIQGVFLTGTPLNS